MSSDLRFISNGILGAKSPVSFEISGAIRAGKTNDRDQIDQHSNTPTFLLHDAPELVPVLGETPSEIYFTFLEDAGSYRVDLRMYTKTELVCKGNGQGTAAAYFAVGDAPGLTMERHPHEKRARVRRCGHFTCPDYQKKLCKEDTFLMPVIPQHSMTQIFRFESRSSYTLNSFRPALNKAMLASLRRQTSTPGAGGIKGEIFRLYKCEEEVPYTDPNTQKTYKGKKHVVYVEHVPFDVYTAKFKDKIKEEDWQILTYLRSLPPRASILDVFGVDPNDVMIGSARAEQVQLSAPPTQAALAGPSDEATQEAALTESANDKTLVELCQKLSDMTGTPNTEDNRKKLVAKMSVPKAIDYLNTKIKSVKKETEAAKEQVTLPPPAVTAPPTAPAAHPGGLL